MEQFFHISPHDLHRAQVRQECYSAAEQRVDQVQQHIARMNPAQQRAYLEQHHRDAMEKFGDLLRPLNLLSSETDTQAVQRLLADMRNEQQRPCNRR